MTIRPAVVVKDLQEINHLKHTIAKLISKIEHYQHLEPPKAQIDTDDDVLNLLSGHMIAPLLREYEAVIASQQSEIVALKFELNKALD